MDFIEKEFLNYVNLWNPIFNLISIVPNSACKSVSSVDLNKMFKP